MLSINEAIAKYKNRVEQYKKWDNLKDIAEEHEQLAEWLELLKWYQQGMEDIPSESGVLPKDVYRAGYIKAIDDFAEKFALEISESIIWGMLVDSDKDNSFQDTADKIVDYVIGNAKRIAEQLKAGGSNE